jgi:hypothetical protein
MKANSIKKNNVPWTQKTAACSYREEVELLKKRRVVTKINTLNTQIEPNTNFPISSLKGYGISPATKGANNPLLN